MNEFKKFLSQTDLKEEYHDSNKIGFFITESLAFASQVHIFHLLSLSGQKHLALKEFYSSLEDIIDSVAEKFIARGGKIESINYEFKTSSDVEFVLNTVSNYRDELTEIIDLMIDDSENQGIFDELVEVQKEIDQFVYRFSLE